MLHALFLALVAPPASAASFFPPPPPPSISITCPDEAKVFCSGSIHPSETGYATAISSCSASPTITYSDAPATLMNCPTDRFQALIIRTWRATDSCGQNVTCEQTIAILRQIWDLDIIPGSCPNTINTLSGPSTLTFAIPGTSAQNVYNLDRNSIRVWIDDCSAGPVSPTSTSYANIAKPFYMDSECECNTATSDSFQDLKIRFSREDLVEGLHLDDMTTGSSPRLVITGSTCTGCTFIAYDCIRVENPPDCNDNHVADSTDISCGTSDDDNNDGIPDECQDIGDEACAYSYWRTHTSAWASTGHTTGQDFDTVFGVNAFSPNRTLLQALQSSGSGSGVNNLGRQGVAALLNAAHPQVDYPLTAAQVVWVVQYGLSCGNPSGVASWLECVNGLCCPLH